MPTHFTLSDIDPEAPYGKEIIKIDGSSFQYPPPCSGSKKRRVDEVYDLNDPGANLLTATELMLEKYIEKVETIDDIVAIHKKDSKKLAKAKRIIKTFKAMLFHNSNRVNDGTMAADSIQIGEAKRDATIAVLETKIMMATEAAENGMDISLWDVDTWKSRLADIKEDHVPNSSIFMHGGSKAPKKKATKAPKGRITEALTKIKGETSSPRGNEDPAMAGNIVGSDGSSGEDGI